MPDGAHSSPVTSVGLASRAAQGRGHLVHVRQIKHLTGQLKNPWSLPTPPRAFSPPSFYVGCATQKLLLRSLALVSLDRT